MYLCKTHKKYVEVNKKGGGFNKYRNTCKILRMQKHTYEYWSTYECTYEGTNKFGSTYERTYDRTYKFGSTNECTYGPTYKFGSTYKHKYVFGVEMGSTPGFLCPTDYWIKCL